MRNYSFYPTIPGTNMGNMAMIQGNFMPSNPQFVGAGANKNFSGSTGKQGIFQNLLNFMKNTGDSGSQFSINPTITNKQVGDSLQQQKNFLLPTPAFPLEGTPGFESKIRKNKINQAVEEANKTGESADFTEAVKNKPKYREITQEELDDILKNLPKEDEKFDVNKYMKDREKFSQSVLNQAYIAGGLDSAGQSILKGSEVAAESVVPNMMAGTTGLLASMAQGNKSIAAAFGVPISPVQRMGYYR